MSGNQAADVLNAKEVVELRILAQVVLSPSDLAEAERLFASHELLRRRSDDTRKALETARVFVGDMQRQALREIRGARMGQTIPQTPFIGRCGDLLSDLDAALSVAQPDGDDG